MKADYQKTIYACFTGYVVQAIINNFVPLLFLTFESSYGIPLSRITLLITINFGIQLLVDLLSAGFVDRVGYRACIVAAHLFSAAGLLGLVILPKLMPDAFIGILMAVIIYALGGGLIEVLISPIMESCPTDNKEKAMSLLHSFYCWGSVAVILLSTLFFALFGIESWRWLSCIWAVIPLCNVFNFAVCPIEHPTEDGKGLSIGSLLKVPLFWLSILLMVCAGASELSMAQWASAFAESALGLSKSMGDIAGPCMFAVTMGISRSLYGKYGEKIDLMKFMIGSGALCLACYITASLSEIPLLGLVGCIVCGFSVGIMWPGTISICSAKIPSGGTAMFALLAMAGDMGGALGPAVVGNISQSAGDNMQKGMFAGCVFPLVLIISVLFVKKLSRLNRV